MIAVVESLLTLAGETLSAAGAALRSRREGFSEQAAGDYLVPAEQMPRIPLDEVRAVLDELPDSTVITIAASIIAGWKPILLKATADLTDVDVLLDVMRDRATQYRIAESAEVPLPDPGPTSSSRRGE